MTEDGMDDESPFDAETARTLRFLKTLVTVLTVTMIGGLLTITAVLVIRLQPGALAPLALPERITLPEGAAAQAYTQGEGWYAVVTKDDRILIYGPDGGAPVQEVEIEIGR